MIQQLLGDISKLTILLKFEYRGVNILKQKTFYRKEN